MKKLFLILLLCHACLQYAFPEDYLLRSPQGKYEVTVSQTILNNGNQRLSYSVQYQGRTVILPSSLTLDIENQYFESALGIPNDDCAQWFNNLRLTSIDTLSVHTSRTPLYGENAVIREDYRGLTLHFMKGDGAGDGDDANYDKRRIYLIDFELRAYDEGVAMRYHFPQAVNGLFLHITADNTEFCLPEGTQAYHAKWAQGPYNVLPLADWKDQCERPLTLVADDGFVTAIGEAGLTDFVRTKFVLGKTPDTIKCAMYDSADIITPYDMPWKVIMAAEKPHELMCREEFFLNLNKPQDEHTDFSFVKPGKVIRACRLDQKSVLEYIDFAASHGLQYVHLDAGWYGNEWERSSDARSVSETRDLDMPAICSYARDRGIGIWVYVNQRSLEQQLDELLPIYKEWGIVGLKFGFVQVGNQHWTTWLHNAVRKCAKAGFMVDIHDEYRPTGVSRTWSNLMTQEGIRGNEEMPDAWSNCVQPFTRFLCGPADYTVCYYSKRIKTTHAHQLALPIVYYSPITFLYWYDTPDLCHGEPELALWDSLPTTWDESIPLTGAIGEYAAIARRQGDTWYVGIINGLEGRELTIPTDFLSKGNFSLTTYSDDETVPTNTHVGVTTARFRAGRPLTVKLEPSGGAVLVFKKQ